VSFVVILLSLALLIVLVSYYKFDTFLSFVGVSILAALFLKIPVQDIPALLERGIGSILGNLTLIIVLGAMLGKLVAECGAAQKIADVMVKLFGVKHLQWGLMITGFIVGIPLFYGIGFVLLVPIIFSIAYQYKLPAVYIGLPMLAALSVAHGFLPPHPSPVALVAIFEADMGIVLMLGIVIAIPSILCGGLLYSQTLKGIKSGPLKLFEPKAMDKTFSTPGKANSFISATLPVFLLILVTLVPYIFKLGKGGVDILALVGSPAFVMFAAIVIATYTLGTKQGRPIPDIMRIYTDAIKDIAPILLIIAGSGIFVQVMKDSGVSEQLGLALKDFPVHPLVLGWMIAAIIRACVGSATVAALTAAGIVAPLVASAGINPNLMVLALGAGSLMFSHVNDSGFWLFKEYFNLSIKDTLRSWAVMEIIVAVVGIAGVMVLNLFL